MQSAKLGKTDRFGSLRFKVLVEKILVCELIISVVVNVLCYITVELYKGGGVSGISAASGDFTVWNASEFVVLHPKIRLENFRCCCEPKQGRVSWS